MSKDDHAQIFQMLSVLFLTISKGQQVQQCIKQVITSHPLFSPMTLFKYISKNGTAIRKQCILAFLQQNKQQVTMDQVKALFQYESCKQEWQYSDFLQLIFPFNSAVLREINNLHMRRYQKLEKYGVHQSSVAGFLLLLTEQIALIRKIEVQKGDSLLKISKQRLRKVLLSIKKAGDRQPSHCQNDDTRITSHELRNFMKAFVSVQDSHFLYLSRRLGLKKGSFPIEYLERFIIPRKKKVNNKVKNNQMRHKTPQSQKQDWKQFDERSYKQQLYDELTSTLNFKESRKKVNKNIGLHAVDMNIRENKPKKEFKAPYQADQQQKERFQPEQNYYIEKQKEVWKNSSPRQLLIRFINVFLPANRELQELKIKVAQHKLDYLGLFKLIDRSQRGVASAEDLYEYYRSVGGRLKLSPRQFQMVISKYAQSDEPWLTFAQFCEMVRAQQKQVYNRNSARLGENVDELIIKILQLSLKSELSILKIRNEFRKHESKYLFDLINRQQTGFINYQQLKKFLLQAGLHISMLDLMAVLKKLDRSRNGVIVQHEFVSYFQPPEGY